MANRGLTDLSYLENLGMGDESLIIDMVELFLENTPESLRLIKKYESEKNWVKLSAEAHKLKPNLSFVGLEQAKALLLEVERSAKNKSNLETVGSNIQQIGEICERAYAELEETLKKLKN